MNTLSRQHRPGAKMKARSKAVLSACAAGATPIEAIYAAMDAVGDASPQKHRRMSLINLQVMGYLVRCSVGGVTHWRLTDLGHAALQPPAPKLSRRQRYRLQQEAMTHAANGARPAWTGEDGGAIADRASDDVSHLVRYAGGVIRIPRLPRSVFDLGGYAP